MLLWIEENQLGRRNLTDDQRAAIALAVFTRRTTLTKKERGGKGGRGHKRKLEDTAVPNFTERARPAVARAARVSERKLRAVAEIAKKNPAVLMAVRSGEKTIKQAKRELVHQEWEQRIASARAIAKSIPEPDRCVLHCCRVSDAPLDADSVDVIITDPPYGREYLPAFSQLATLAARVLKPGGSLLVMSGQFHLPEVMRRLTTEDLNWQWVIALICKGQATRIFPRNVTPMWKPVLWYVKGKYQGDCVIDVITSDQNDKRFHEWGQSESGMAALVERFSLPGQTILDPFVGGGTTAK